jgi:hypothetical protein
MPPSLIHEGGDTRKDLLRALAMPFQLTTLLFVALTSVLLGFFISGDLIRLVVSLAAMWLLLVWLTQYALHLIDDAANGEHQSAAASVEMATAFLDARAWVHPAMAVGIAVALYFNPDWPRLPVLIAAALFFPASLGACAISGHALHALHPGRIAGVMFGLGVWYPVVVAFTLGCALVGMLVAQQLESRILIVATVEMLLLLVYAGIGGVLYVRRRELDFEPRKSPERVARRVEDDRHADRQRFVDELYGDLRVRESAKAAAKVTTWLRETKPEHLKGDLHALLQAGAGWNEPRAYPQMLRALLPVLLEMKQPALAFSLVEAGLAAAPTFAPAAEAEALVMIRYAQQTGRRRAARTLLENYLGAKGAPAPSAAMQALRATVMGEAG